MAEIKFANELRNAQCLLNPDIRDLFLHDVKSPIRRIKTLSNLLGSLQLDGCALELQSEITSYLELTDHQALRLVELLDRIAHYERLDFSDDIAAPFSVRSIVAETASHSFAGQHVHWVVDGDVNHTGSPVALRTVLQELFDNVLKFATPAGNGTQCSILIVNAETGKSAESLKILVRDNGSGFHASTRHKLFMPMCRLHPEKSGAGMGLTICQKILQQLHGSIDLIEADCGASFQISLPQN